VEKGDRYAVMMYNRPEMVQLMAAATILGSMIVPVDPRSKGEKLVHQLKNSKSKALFLTADLLERVDEIAKQISDIKIFTIEKPGALASGDVSKYRSIQEILESPFTPVDYRKVSLGDPMQIIYTSGTTGDPKGVVNECYRLPVYGALLSRYWDYRADDVLYNGLSLTHGNHPRQCPGRNFRSCFVPRYKGRVQCQVHQEPALGRNQKIRRYLLLPARGHGGRDL